MHVVLPPETDVFCLAYAHVCSIYRFLSVVQLGSQCPPFFILGDGEQCKSLLSPKSILLVFFLLLDLFLIVSNWEPLPSSSFIAEWIPEWKNWNGCFPIWGRLRSIEVCLAGLLDYRGTCNYCRFPAEAYRCLLVS